MKAILSRIGQLQAQLNDPEILNKKKIEAKLEAYNECLELVKNENIRESEEFCNCTRGKVTDWDIDGREYCIDCGRFLGAKEVSNRNNPHISGLKIMDWINVNDKLPEDFEELIIKPTDELSPTKTKRVLALTDTGSITDNRRLKMQVGEKEWTWFMGYDGEEVIKWAVFEEPTE